MGSAWDATPAAAAPAAAAPSGGSAWDSAPVAAPAAAPAQAAPQSGGSAWDSSPATSAVSNDPKDVRGMVARIATEMGVDPTFALRIAQQESGFNPNAVSPVGAQGVMQLMPETARGLGVKNSLDAEQNIRGGVTYLKRLLAANNGDTVAAAASYNAGPGAWQNHVNKGTPLPTETQNYVQAVTGKSVAAPTSSGSAWDAPQAAPAAPVPAPAASPAWAKSPDLQEIGSVTAKPSPKPKPAAIGAPPTPTTPEQKEAQAVANAGSNPLAAVGDFIGKSFSIYGDMAHDAGKVYDAVTNPVAKVISPIVDAISNHETQKQVDFLKANPQEQLRLQQNDPAKFAELKAFSKNDPGLLSPDQMAQLNGKAEPWMQPYAGQKGTPQHSILESAGAALDLPFIYLGAAMRSSNKTPEEVQAETDRAMAMYKHDPVQANEEYGLMAKKQLEAMRDGKDPANAGFANYFLNHPRQAAVAAFGSEFINPANDLVGGALGALGKGASAIADQTQTGRFAKNYFSPYREIAAEAGQDGKAKAMNIVAQQPVEHADAAQKVTQIFGGLTPEQAWDVKRRSQLVDAPADVQEANRLDPNARTWIDANPSERARMDKEGLARPPVRMPVEGKIDDPTGDLQQRADLYRATIKDMTARQEAVPGLLNDTRIKDPDVYVPMAGAYRDASYEEDMQRFVDNISSSQRAGGGINVRKGTGSDPGPHQENSYVDDMLNAKAQDGTPLLREDYHPAEGLYKFLSRRGSNVAFEETVNKLPETLRRDITPSDFVTGEGDTLAPIVKGVEDGTHAEYSPSHPQGRFYNILQKGDDELPADYYQRLADRYNNRAVNGEQIGTADPQYMHLRVPDGYVKSSDVASSIGSPTLKGSFISPAFAGFLGDKTAKGSSKAAGVFGNKALHEEGSFFANAQTALEKYDSMYRNAILTNPVVHPLGNVATNAAAAMGDNLGQVAKRYTKTALNLAMSTIPPLQKVFGEGTRGEQLLSKVFGEGQKDYTDAAQWYQRARKGGATYESGFDSTALGGSKVTTRLAPMNSLNESQKWDQRLTKAVDWNNEATFGKLGEEPHAVELFKHFVEKGYQDETAGMLTREVLGNYRNVDPNSWQAKTIMFYPWLKGNMAFWLKSFTTKPKYWQAWEEAARRNNELTDDPRLHNYKQPRSDFEFYTGDGKNDESWRPAMSMNMAADAVNVFQPHARLEQQQATTEKVFRNRLKPVLSTLMDLHDTMIKDPADPSLPWNFRTVYDKDETNQVKVEQFARYMLAHNVPVPLLGPAIEDIARQGFDPKKIPTYVKNMAGVGQFSQRDNEKDAMALSVIHGAFSGAQRKVEQSMTDQDKKDTVLHNLMQKYYAARDRYRAKHPSSE